MDDTEDTDDDNADDEDLDAGAKAVDKRSC